MKARARSTFQKINDWQYNLWDKHIVRWWLLINAVCYAVAFLLIRLLTLVIR